MSTFFFGHHEIAHLLATYGYLVIALMVAVEGMGIPLPGETTLIAAAIVAGTSHELNIELVIAAASAGAIAGDNAGFWIGRSLGYRLLRRFGRYVGLTDRRILLGQFLFGRYGGTLVLIGRFIALLRTLAPFVAGANRMPWRRFAAFNAAGGILWSSVFGLSAYWLGKEAHGVMGRAGALLAVLGIAAIGAGWWFLRRNEARLEADAERSPSARLQPLPLGIDARSKENSRMNLDTFKATLARDEPPELSPALRALWWDAKGDWHKAHGCAQQDEKSAGGTWVHAYLHRKEGDLTNAGHWYRRADRPVATTSLEAEWATIARALLAET